MPIRAIPLALLLVVLAAGCKKSPGAAGGPAPAAAGAAAPKVPPAAALPTGNDPYAVLARAYSPYTDAGDPLGFPMKVRNLSSDPYRFWRGSKELFFEWGKANFDDWMKDEPAYLRTHGDLHPGNLGLYHSQGKFGRHVAFGAVDFDDSARLPFQVELLEGVVTLDLLAGRRKIKLRGGQVDEVIAAMIDAYRASLESDQSPTDLLEEDRMVGKMLKDARKRDYGDELAKFLHGDQFEPAIIDKKGNVKEILTPAKGKAAFADAIQEGLVQTPDGRDLFKTADVGKKLIEAIARRTQLESAGSEGLHKYLLLVKNKKSPDGKLILYVKQQIPSSAERVGIIPMDPRPPGQRAAEDMHLMSRPASYFSSWCSWNDGSYRLSIKEPWSETMDGADVDGFEDLKHVARVWGTVAGSLHRQGPDVVANVKARLTPDLAAQLRTRGLAYAAKVAKDYDQFRSDPRARADVDAAQQGLKDLQAKAR